MVDIGLKRPDNAIVERGEPLIWNAKLETATNVYPGRLLKKDTTDADVEVCAAEDTAVGWAGYEDTLSLYQNANEDTVYEANDRISVLCGGHFIIVGSVIASSNTVTKGKTLYASTAGQLTQHGTTPVGIAMESLAAGGGDCMVLSLI